MTATAVPPTDPTGSTILAAAAAASGIDPWLLLPGFLGSYWSLSYVKEPIPWPTRVGRYVIGTFVGAWSGKWGAPPLAALFAHWWDWWPPEAGGKGLAIMISLVVGLLAHRYIGPALGRKVEQVAT
jgi:hypothetical protein